MAATAFGPTAAAQPDVAGRLNALAAKHPSFVEVSTIGSSLQGRPLHVVWLTDKAEVPGPGAAREHRPALLIIAGASGMHRVGVETALAVAERIADEHAAALKGASAYVIPLLNPDSFAFHAEPGRPKADFGRTIRPIDADRDGRTNEDPPEDLNGDGVITTMRLADPAPGSPWPATLAADPENPRLMKAPDAAKGESARYAVFIEGTDNDGDGRFNEDGPGGSGGGRRRARLEHALSLEGVGGRHRRLHALRTRGPCPRPVDARPQDHCSRAGLRPA